MPAGFFAATETGNIQFTNDYSNFVLIAKGTVTLGAPWTYFSTTGGPFATITLPNLYGYPPLMVLNCAQPIFIRDAVTDANGNWVFGLAGAYLAAQGAVVEWFAYGPPHAGLPRVNYGFEIFKYNGEIAYSSNWKPLRIVGEVSNQAGGSLQYNGPAGRKLGVVHVIDSFTQSDPIPAGTWRVVGNGSLHQVNGSQVTMSFAQIYDTIWGTRPPFATAYNQPRAQHMVADITDY